MDQTQPRRTRILAIVYPSLAALLWGVAFVFQRRSAGSIGAFAFNGCRALVAFVSLGVYLALRRKALPIPKDKNARKHLLKGGIVCGVALYAAANAQQLGMVGTEAGKAAFITASYTVLVPVFGFFLGKRFTGSLWVSVGLACVGLWLLCMKGSFVLNRYDLLEIICAVIYAWYILAVDYYAVGTNAVALSCVQFLVFAVLSWGTAFFVETVRWSDIAGCTVSILYLGIFSSAVAYTLQMKAQQIANPVTTTMSLSQESTISVIAGAIALGEWLSGRELFGCLLMLTAVILAQFPDAFRARRKRMEEE